jgi:hypothetical protein
MRFGSISQAVKERSSILFGAITIVLVVLFGLKDFLILVSDQWPHLYPVANAPTQTWEEVYIYLPFANHFSLGNPLPMAPMVEPAVSGFTAFPAITLIVQGVLFKFAFLSNVDAYLLAMHVVLPIASFWFLYAIFSRHIHQAWALLFAFLGISFISDFSSLGYILGLLFQANNIVDSGSLSPLEITRTPIPSLTFLAFISTYYVTVKSYRISQRRLVLLSVLWAVQLYIYLFNFIPGLLFWFGYIILARRMTDRGFLVAPLIRSLLVASISVAIVLVPVAIKYLFFDTPLDREFIDRLQSVSANESFISSDWGPWISYLLPVGIMIIVIWISCADYYEAIYRFGSVFILAVVELLVLNLQFVPGQFFDNQLFSVRVAVFFDRFLYFVPVVYFLSLPQKRLFKTGILSRVSTGIYPIISLTMERLRIPIAFVVSFSIALLLVASSLRYLENHDQVVAPRMAVVDKRLEALVDGRAHGTLVVSEDIAVNLLLPSLSDQTTLLTSSFNNQVSSDDILQRLILYSKIFGWNQQRFLEFMMPNPTLQSEFGSNGFVMSDNFLTIGLGYWLLHHQKVMGADELQKYQQLLSTKYAQFDMTASLQKHHVVAVQGLNPVESNLPIVSQQRAGDSIVYELQVTSKE